MMLAILILTMMAAAAPTQRPSCALDEADKRANAALSFDDFDQKGTLPSSARKLGETGCCLAAAEATADYLIHGSVASPGEQRVLLFHLGQALALGGEEKRGADFIAATRKPVTEPRADGELNWNEYVLGTWAFLKKNRPVLAAARDAVLAGGSQGDAINGAILAALERCFDKPYATAYDPDCEKLPSAN